METKICSKCKVEKELDQYENYWHSTQQKTRTRGYCKVCMEKQKKAYRLKRNGIEYIPTYQPDYIKYPDLYKKCIKCLEYLLIDSNFYVYKKNNWIASTCKQCQKRIDKENYQRTIGTSNLYPMRPNEYHDEEQRLATFGIMERMGFTFNKDKGIWWKDGFRTEDGIFMNVTGTKRKKHDTTNRHLTYKQKMLLIERAIAYRRVGRSMLHIAEILGIAETTVTRWIKDYEESKYKL
jgi:hypothetical protein